MNIESRTVGPVQVLDCSGKMTLGDATMAVRNKVREILDNGGKKILINLGEVPYIDSSGVGALVSSFTTVSGKGGQLKLVNLTPKTRELLTVTRLLTVFEVFDSEQKAIASFA